MELPTLKQGQFKADKTCNFSPQKIGIFNLLGVPDQTELAFDQVKRLDGESS